MNPYRNSIKRKSDITLKKKKKLKLKQTINQVFRIWARWNSQYIAGKMQKAQSF